MDHEDALGIAAARAVTFRERLPFRPQRPLQDFAASRALFAEPLPEEGEEASACIDDLADRAEPGLHAKVGDRFFGWVIGGSHPVGVAPGWLTSAWGQNAGNHQASPAAAAAEAVAAGWLLELLELPRESSVGFVTGLPSPTSSVSPPQGARCCAASAGTSRPTACSVPRRSPC